MSHFILRILIIGLFILSGCSQDVGGPSSGGYSSTDGDTSLVVSDGTPLYFYVRTRYDNFSESMPIVPHGSCEIDPTNLAANNISCTISIPEGMLRFSETYMTVGTNNSILCPRLEFYPYYRRMSVSAGTAIVGEDSPFDCSGSINQIDPKCLDGAAVDIVQDFPKYTGVWFATNEIQTKQYTVKPGYSNGSYGNTRVCNNLVNKNADVNQGGYQLFEDIGTAGAVWQDYYVRCVDPYQGTLFSITITIEDEDTESSVTDGVNDEFYDWN